MVVWYVGQALKEYLAKEVRASRSVCWSLALTIETWEAARPCLVGLMGRVTSSP